jgi:cell division protein FtsN
MHRSLSRRTQAGGTLIGVFIGLVLGIVVAAAVGLYVTGGWKAYRQQTSINRDTRDRETVKGAKAEAEKPRFDFYKILPGGEEPKVATPKPPPAPDRGVADRAAERSSGKTPEVATPKPAEPTTKDATAARDAAAANKDAAAKASSPDRFWLQAGSFASEADADNLRARLAFAGWEAKLQQGTLADKSVRYRVRLGPYDNTDELNRVKGELARRGFDVAVIKY